MTLRRGLKAESTQAAIYLLLRAHISDYGIPSRRECSLHDGTADGRYAHAQRGGDRPLPEAGSYFTGGVHAAIFNKMLFNARRQSVGCNTGAA